MVLCEKTVVLRRDLWYNLKKERKPGGICMDERIMQLKQMKKTCRRLKAGAGRGWKAMAWVFFVLCLGLAGMTVFVRCYDHPLVQAVDLKLWEPLKAAVGLKINYSAVWCLVENWGMVAVVAGGVLWLLFAVLGLRAVSAVKKSEAFLNLRTLVLTLKAEKEEQ